LKTISSLGTTNVETSSFYGHSASEFRKLLESAGLNCVGIVTPYVHMSSDIDTVIADAKNVGATYVIVSDIPHNGTLTEAETRKAAADFNTWGQSLRSRGLVFGYHPHGFEFVHTPTATLFDVLVAETSPQFVTFELDAFWFSHGGADPSRFLEKYPNRFALMHLKDIAPGTKQDLSGAAPDTSSVALGQGLLRWNEILRIARGAGIKEYLIEDESPEAPKQVPISLNYLHQIEF
jgi:sugar phosphate isomerase/epimerase